MIVLFFVTQDFPGFTSSVIDVQCHPVHCWTSAQLSSAGWQRCVLCSALQLYTILPLIRPHWQPQCWLSH